MDQDIHPLDEGDLQVKYETSADHIEHGGDDARVQGPLETRYAGM